MGNDGAGVVEGLPSPLTFKVHVRMCSELLNLVVQVSEIIPEIEAVRPHGIEVLCLLHNGVAEAKSLLQRCSDSSILYLALTGDAILSRCNKSRNLLEQNLSQIQSMVPVMLAAKISGIILALRSAAFCLDPMEKKARKALREMIHRCDSTMDSTEEYALSAIHTVCFQLHISSQRALVIEKRSIRKLLDKLGESKQSKRNILLFFLSLLNKYGKIKAQEQKVNLSAEHEDPFPFASPCRSEEAPDAKVQEAQKLCETSTNSIASLGSSMNDLNLPLDFSNISLGSNQDSDTSCAKIINTEFCAFPCDSSCNAVENVKRLLKISDESWSMMPFGKLIQLLLRFLKDAHDLHDVEAQITGCLYLLEFLQKDRNSILSYMNEDAYILLVSFLDTEVAKQALSILEVLSFNQHCGYKIAASGALVGILNILEGQVEELLELALNILSHLCRNSDIGPFILPSEIIPKLIPLFENSNLARYCVTILKSLCDNRDTKSFLAEIGGCIPSIAKLLENGSREEQEHAVSILLSLCCRQVQYCRLVMDEGVIPGLVYASINGNEKARAMAMELMQILKDELKTTGESCVLNVITDSTKQNERQLLMS